MTGRLPAPPLPAEAPPLTAAPPVRHGPSTADYALLGVLGLIFGSTYMFVGVGVQSIPPLSLAAGRVLIGFAALASVAVILGHRVPRDWRSWRAYFVIGLIGFALPFTLMNVSQQYIDSSLAAILITSAPLFTLVLSHFFTDDRASWRKLAGVAIGFAGVLLLLGPAAISGKGGSLFGQLLYVAVGFLFALTQVLIRRLGIGSGTPLMRAVCTTFTTSFWLVPAALIFEAPWAIVPTAASLYGMLALGLLTSAVAHIVMFRLNANVGPNFVAANNFIAPPVGLFWGAILLGEEITWLRVAAMLVIFTGIAFATSRIRIARRAAH